MDMYFVALVAPDDVAARVLEWKNWMRDRFDCHVALRSPAHITLVPPFRMDTGNEAFLVHKLDMFAEQARPFAVCLDGFSAFAPRVLFVAVAENPPLADLQAHLQHYLANADILPVKKETRPFTPHVTIATRDLRKGSFRDAWEYFKTKTYRANWQVTGISLLRHNQKNWDVAHTSQFASAL